MIVVMTCHNASLDYTTTGSGTFHINSVDYILVNPTTYVYNIYLYPITIVTQLPVLVIYVVSNNNTVVNCADIFWYFRSTDYLCNN